MLYTPEKPTLTLEAEQDFLEGLSVSHRYQLQHPANANVIQAKFSPDSRLIALSFLDGSLSVHNSLQGDLCHKVQEAFESGTVQIPPTVTSLCWRGRDSLLACTADGRLLSWSLLQGLSTIHTTQENSYMTIDSGSHVVCAGKLPQVEVFDSETGKPVQTMKSLGNKIICAKFDKSDGNVIYSGGWDPKVLLWDIRQGKRSAGQIQGPQICGEALDTTGHRLLTGSHSLKDGI